MKKSHKMILYHSKLKYQFDFYFKKYFQVVKQLKMYFTIMNINDIFEMIQKSNKYYFL